MKVINTVLLLLLFLPKSWAAESNETLISPTKEEWIEAATDVPQNWKAIISAKQLPMIGVSSSFDDRVYALHSFPDAKNPMHWRIDLQSVISTYNALFVTAGGPIYSATSGHNFGTWSAPSGGQTYFFKLQWAFLNGNKKLITVDGIGQSPGASIWKSDSARYRHDMNYAFANSFLVLAMHLRKQLSETYKP